MNNLQPVKTTLTFNPLFHQRLKSLAQASNASMSQVVQDELTPIIQQRRQEQAERLFKAFEAIKGMVKDDATDASATIDDVLYGKPGEGLVSEERAA